MKIKELFERLAEQNSYIRIDDSHPIDIYVGCDEKNFYSIVIISPFKPLEMSSSRMISIDIGTREDKQWALSFSLKDAEFLDIFSTIWNDLIEYTRSLDNTKQSIEIICNRFLTWQKMLEKLNNQELSEIEIKGVIAELYFLKNFMITKYGESKAINAWVGPDMISQDFICDKVWYEVKSIAKTAEKVKISSIAQLDSHFEGELVLISLEKTSLSDGNAITINQLLDSILNSLKDINLKYAIIAKLVNLGFYCQKSYDNFVYYFDSMQRYTVNKNFPCLRKDKLPIAIISAKYELSLNEISSFMIKE